MKIISNIALLKNESTTKHGGHHYFHSVPYHRSNIKIKTAAVICCIAK